MFAGFLPPPPEPSTFIDQVTSLGEPTLASLGLGGYWPSGWVQNLLEAIHVYADVPWFTSIIASECLLSSCNASGVSLFDNMADKNIFRII